MIFFFQVPFCNKLIQGLFQLDLENISNLIQDQLVEGWVRRAILLLLVMVLICLVECLLFYFLTGKLIKTFKKTERQGQPVDSLGLPPLVLGINRFDYLWFGD
ncbi:TPA: hypothetical protein U2B30_000582 [Streptococcus suis]|nr:hypothetical protein [Streptococcus suis]